MSWTHNPTGDENGNASMDATADGTLQRFLQQATVPAIDNQTMFFNIWCWVSSDFDGDIEVGFAQLDSSQVIQSYLVGAIDNADLVKNAWASYKGIINVSASSTVSIRPIVQINTDATTGSVKVGSFKIGDSEQAATSGAPAGTYVGVTLAETVEANAQTGQDLTQDNGTQIDPSSIPDDSVDLGKHVTDGSGNTVTVIQAMNRYTTSHNLVRDHNFADADGAVWDGDDWVRNATGGEHGDPCMEMTWTDSTDSDSRWLIQDVDNDLRIPCQYGDTFAWSIRAWSDRSYSNPQISVALYIYDETHTLISTKVAAAGLQFPASTWSTKSGVLRLSAVADQNAAFAEVRVLPIGNIGSDPAYGHPITYKVNRLTLWTLGNIDDPVEYPVSVATGDGNLGAGPASLTGTSSVDSWGVLLNNSFQENVPLFVIHPETTNQAATFEMFLGQRDEVHAEGGLQLLGISESRIQAHKLRKSISGTFTGGKWDYEPLWLDYGGATEGVGSFGDFTSVAMFGPASNTNSSLAVFGTLSNQTPVAGVNNGSLWISNQDRNYHQGYGMGVGVRTSGNTWLQSGRTDGVTSLYAIELNPLGGAVHVGPGSLYLPNNTPIYGEDSLGSSKNLIQMNSNDDIMIANNTGNDVMFNVGSYGSGRHIELYASAIALSGASGSLVTTFRQQHMGYGGNYYGIKLGAGDTYGNVFLGVDALGVTGGNFNGYGQTFINGVAGILTVNNNATNWSGFIGRHGGSDRVYVGPYTIGGFNAGPLEIDGYGATNMLTVRGVNNMFSYHDSGGVGWASGSGGSYGELLYMHRSNATIYFYANNTQQLAISSTSVQAPNRYFEVTGNPSLPTPAGNGSTILAAHSYWGAFLYGQGSYADFSLVNRATSVTGYNLANTTHWIWTGQHRIDQGISDNYGYYQINLGIFGTGEGRSLVAGFEGGNYPGIGYNVRTTSTTNSLTAVGGDYATWMYFGNYRFSWYAIDTGSAGRAFSTTVGNRLAQLSFTNPYVYQYWGGSFAHPWIGPESSGWSMHYVVGGGGEHYWNVAGTWRWRMRSDNGALTPYTDAGVDFGLASYRVSTGYALVWDASYASTGHEQAHFTSSANGDHYFLATMHGGRGGAGFSAIDVSSSGPYIAWYYHNGAGTSTTQWYFNHGTSASYWRANFYPYSDNTYANGTSSYRWTVVYALNGTIQTSDATMKRDVSLIDGKTAYLICRDLELVKHKWIDDPNGDWAYGVIAQRLVRVFAKHGLDAHEYSFLDYSDSGMYGINYAGLVPLLLAAQQFVWELQNIDRLISED